MIKIGLFDGSFTAPSISVGGDAADLRPASIEYVRGKHLQTTVYTDMHISSVKEAPVWENSVALLVEPPSISTTHYKLVERYAHRFDHIFTFWDNWGQGSRVFEKTKFYPLGGTWIDPIHWRVVDDKPRMCSFIISEKEIAPGHLLRREFFPFARAMGVDCWGRGVQPMVSKLAALEPYRFSVVIESVRARSYFSEKLIDCFALGVMPIYWGCPGIDRFFNPWGMIVCSSLEEIIEAVKEVSLKLYQQRLPAIRENMETARQYMIAEDWIFENYPGVLYE